MSFAASILPPRDRAGASRGGLLLHPVSRALSPASRFSTRTPRRLAFSGGGVASLNSLGSRVAFGGRGLFQFIESLLPQKLNEFRRYFSDSKPCFPLPFHATEHGADKCATLSQITRTDGQLTHEQFAEANPEKFGEAACRL